MDYLPMFAKLDGRPVLLVGGGGLFGMGQSNAGLKSVYDDRVVPLKQIKVVADM